LCCTRTLEVQFLPRCHDFATGLSEFVHFRQEIVDPREGVGRPDTGLRPTFRQEFRDSRAEWSGSMMGRLLTQSRSRRMAMASRILVVDDEPMVRALIARALTDEGYEVVAVANGRAALDAARGAEARFDLIITNNYMPGLSGAELVARVRKDFPNLPILHVDDITRRGRIPPLPADVPTVYKPFSIAALKAAVSGLLQREQKN
jgi:two-component system, cell cycle response regulator CpdR